MGYRKKNLSFVFAVLALGASMSACPVYAQETTGIVSAEGVYSEEAPSEKTPAEETPSEEVPAEETPVEETPPEEVPSEEVPSEETSAEETPPEEVPSEETPSEAEGNGPVFLPIFVRTEPLQDSVAAESTTAGEADVLAVMDSLDRLTGLMELLSGVAYLILMAVSIVAGLLLSLVCVRFYRGCGHG